MKQARNGLEVRIAKALNIRSRTVKVNEYSIWTYSTSISLTRLPMSIWVAVLISQHDSIEKIVSWLVLIVLSDFLDGFIARNWEGTTVWGALVDASCDKFAVGITCSSLWFQIWPWVGRPLACIEVLLFFISVAAGIALKKGIVLDPNSNYGGKIKFTFECLGILALVKGYSEKGNNFLTAALFFAFVSVIGKLPETLRVLRRLK